MNERKLKQHLLETYQVYIEGFKTNNVKLIDTIVRYPIVYLKDGAVKMCDQYTVDPAKLKCGFLLPESLEKV